MKEVPNALKHKRIAMMAFAVLAAALFVYFLLFRFDVVSNGITSFFSILAPIIYGFILAYVLNPPMRLMENCTLKLWAWRKKTPTTKTLTALRVTCSIFSVLLLLLIVSILIMLLLPQIVESIQALAQSLPAYFAKIQTWYNDFINTYALDDNIKAILASAIATLQDWLSGLLSTMLNSVAGKVTNSVVDIFGFFKNIMLGLIVAIYVMVAQDSIMARAKRICYAFCNVATANQILKNCRFVDEKFGGFLIGKIIDSAIIGVLCYFGLLLIDALFIDIQYIELIAVIIGVTNVIPFFGPFIGAIPCGFLLLCADPISAIWFMGFIFLLQQFDGNLLGPKILGNSVGVSSFMVLVAILIGGGFFGFPGMIIGVPLCAILTSVIQAHVLQRIANKDLPGDIAAYQNMEKLDPWTRKVIPSKIDTENSSFYTRISQRSADIANFYVKLTNNPWDRTAEDVEQQRVQFKAEWEADNEYCKKYANKRDEFKVKGGPFTQEIIASEQNSPKIEHIPIETPLPEQPKTAETAETPNSQTSKTSASPSETPKKKKSKKNKSEPESSASST